MWCYENCLSGAQLHAADFHLLSCDARRVLNRTFIAEQLLDCGTDLFRVVTQLAHLFGMLQECVHAIADQIAGGSVPSKEQHQALGVKPFFGEDLSIFFDID
jgi:hypothetical protein